MAGSLALNVQILGEFGKLTAATKGATSQLSGLSKTATSISQGMNKAFGLIGVGFSLNFLKNALNEAGKEAVADAKSMNILALAMENTGFATAATVKEAEASIKKMSLQSAIADDELRPAFQKLFIATGDVTKSNRYLQIALDASAATGKDLDSVSQAMAKSLAGSDTALLKLIPSLKGAQDPLGQLEKTFKGAAEEAANTDPYQRLNIVFGEIKESIGNALIPILNSLADWFIDVLPDIERFFDSFSKAMNDPQVRESTKRMADSLGKLGDSIASLFGSTETDQAKGFVNFWTILSSLLSEIADFLNLIVANVSLLTGNTKPFEKIISPYVQGAAELLGVNFVPTVPDSSGRSDQGRGPITVTNNIQVKTDATAKEIADAINRANRASGTNLIRAR
jgi:hypothetical protein